MIVPLLLRIVSQNLTVSRTRSSDRDNRPDTSTSPKLPRAAATGVPGALVELPTDGTPCANEGFSRGVRIPATNRRTQEIFIEFITMRLDIKATGMNLPRTSSL